MNFWLIQIFNGLSFAMLLFLLATGLSLIFGLMRVVSMVHGSFYLVGGYIGLSVIQPTGSFILGMIGAGIATGLLGVLTERFLIRPLYRDANDLRQVLVTFGLLFILADLSMVIWGGQPLSIPRPKALAYSIQFGSMIVPAYRLAILFGGLVVALLLWLVIDKTRIGSMVRAAVDDREIAEATGVPVYLLFTSVFAFGALLAGVAGVIGGAFLGLSPGADFDVLLLAFVVVVVGGMGSIKGAFAGSVIVGLIDTFGKVFFPEFALFTLFLPIVVILALKPTGLFGREVT
jgi:branched-chain amino acid transport system permease protein